MSSAAGGATKFKENIIILRAIGDELKKAIKTATTRKDPSIEHMLNLFRANEVTEKRFCRPADHYKYFAQTYLTYLQSTRLQSEIMDKYFSKGERSIEDSARLVGLQLPKTIASNNKKEAENQSSASTTMTPK